MTLQTRTRRQPKKTSLTEEQQKIVLSYFDPKFIWNSCQLIASILHIDNPKRIYSWLRNSGHLSVTQPHIAYTQEENDLIISMIDDPKNQLSTISKALNKLSGRKICHQNLHTHIDRMRKNGTTSRRLNSRDDTWYCSKDLAYITGSSEATISRKIKNDGMEITSKGNINYISREAAKKFITDNKNWITNKADWRLIVELLLGI